MKILNCPTQPKFGNLVWKKMLPIHLPKFYEYMEQYVWKIPLPIKGGKSGIGL